MKLSECIEHCGLELDRAGLCFGHGTDNARDEAAWLVLSALQLPVAGPLPPGDLVLSGGQQKQVSGLLRQRIEMRQPLAYLTGEAWFCGMRFEVTPAVLVPRSPIAELIARQFRPWVEPEAVHRALDLGTGCGCIAIAMARHMPQVRVDATDISRKALAVASRNRALHGMEKAVELIRSDLFNGLQGRRYDLLVSNPPYVSRQRFETLPAEYRAEPETGLVSPGQGLSIPLRILSQAPDFMTEDAVLVCEVGESAALLSRLLPGLPLTWPEFEHGGEGVFTIGRRELLAYRPAITASLEKLQHVV
ncbi:MAG TPA: 50S ribosomal protein L3 N(5)-glutamine methyltransferase [Xanthomonadales bacterium]|nr:50S ribosomal protein L3 N(5)-glutamine methyltransferase [Xanthomonadales bacterium]